MIKHHPTVYIGLREISKRMDCSTRRLLHWNRDLGFPLMIWFYDRSGFTNPRKGWAYCAYEERIQDWYRACEAATRRKVQSTRYAQNNGHSRIKPPPPILALKARLARQAKPQTDKSPSLDKAS